MQLEMLGRDALLSSLLKGIGNAGQETFHTRGRPNQCVKVWYGNLLQFTLNQFCVSRQQLQLLCFDPIGLELLFGAFLRERERGRQRE